jgi:peptide/nickel transport system substrate-binding protein
MPGVAQKLVGAISPERLAHLGLGPMPPASGDPGWGGPPAELVVDASAPYLVEIARVIAPILTRPGHEVNAVPVPRTEVARRKSRAAATLALELVRPFSPFASGILPALASLEDLARAKDLARHPPKFAPQTAPRQLTATLRSGVIGDVRVAGGVVPDLSLARAPGGDGWDLGASSRKSSRK